MSIFFKDANLIAARHGTGAAAWLGMVVGDYIQVREGVVGLVVSPFFVLR